MNIRIVCNTFKLGGAERSMSTLATLLMERGHEVTWHPTLNNEWGMDPPCARGRHFREDPLECDVLIYCTNNSILPLSDRRRSLPPPDLSDWADKKARRKIMIVNWEMGDGPVIDLAFDSVAFLSDTLRRKWIQNTGRALRDTWVHAPCVDIKPFLELEPSYDSRIMARHSFPNKWPNDSITILWSMKQSAPGWTFRTMGMPLRISDPEVRQYGPGQLPVPTFLQGASAYWYALPYSYAEQGPRTVVEAMAAGLPCMVDNRDGPAERVPEEAGWKVNSHGLYGPILARVSLSELREKGEAARAWARREMDPIDWVHYAESFV